MFRKGERRREEGKEGGGGEKRHTRRLSTLLSNDSKRNEIFRTSSMIFHRLASALSYARIKFLPKKKRNRSQWNVRGRNGSTVFLIRSNVENDVSGRQGKGVSHLGWVGSCTPPRSIFYNMAGGGWQVRGWPIGGTLMYAGLPTIGR